MIEKIFKYKILIFVAIVAIMFVTMEFFVAKLKKDHYDKFSHEYSQQLETLIKEKQHTTNIIALSLSNNQLLKDALKNNKPADIDIEGYTRQLRQSSDFKNVWFQIVDKKGKSFKRSWTKKRGDSLIDIRLDVNMMIKNPKIMSTISTGKFDMTFKAMVPVMDKGEFIGIFEVITHFNSISKKLKEQNIDGVFLVDKSYEKQLTKAFTKTFVKNYYVANLDASPSLLEYLRKVNLENYLNFEEKYFIDESQKKFVVLYNLPDKLGKKMGHLLMFKDLSALKIDNLSSIRQMFLFSTIFLILFLIILELYIKNRKSTQTITKNNKKLLYLNEQNLVKIKQLQTQKNKTKKIFNAQPTITIITDGKTIHDANSSFFDFFSQYKSLSEFVKDHDCVCDFFEKYDGSNYIVEKIIDNLTWIEYILSNPDISYKVMMKKDDIEHHFIVNANRSNYIEENGQYLIVVSFLDITDEVYLHNDLRNKDKMLMQQSKLASMGEMIGNIAHQWRQPLSVISTSASLLSIKDQYTELEEEDIDKYVDAILKNTEYLSRTIDDFRDFFKPDKKKKFFDIKETVEKTLYLVSPKFNKSHIEVVKDMESYKIKGFESEMLQVFINIFNNAKDILETKEDQRRLIMISFKKKNDHLVISIKDNGGGVDDTIIDRIFEPYFTTKHKSQGTGIGLYMVEEMVAKHMEGTIEVKNDLYEYDGEKYKGANFILKLPLS